MEWINSFAMAKTIFSKRSQPLARFSPRRDVYAPKHGIPSFTLAGLGQGDALSDLFVFFCSFCVLSPPERFESLLVETMIRWDEHDRIPCWNCHQLPRTAVTLWSMCVLWSLALRRDGRRGMQCTSQYTSQKHSQTLIICRAEPEGSNFYCRFYRFCRFYWFGLHSYFGFRVGMKKNQPPNVPTTFLSCTSCPCDLI